MASNQSLDLDFQFLDHQDFFLELACDKGDDSVSRVNVDDLLEPEPKNPVFGHDFSLASALNLDSDDDFLAYAPTDPLGGFHTVKVIETKQSPWHESDSGMSDTTPSSSPQRSSLADNAEVGPAPAQVLQNVEELNVNVEDLNFEFDQYSPSSSAASSPHTGQDSRNADSLNVSLVDELITVDDVQQQQALEFYEATDLFSGSDEPRTVRLVKAQQCHQDAPEDRSRKNAIQAKMNREKKKAYIKSLEQEISSLRADNTKLKSENKRMQSNMSDLEEEVEYLKSVLVNSSSLSGLLKNISNVKEVKLSATVLGRKRLVTEDHSYNFVASVPEKRARRINENLKKAGVCLHVNGGSACLEFCAHCSKLAHKTSLS